MSAPVRLPDDDEAIPLEAPLAPTEEEWARMTPAARERAIDALLASESQEELDEREAMAEGDQHSDAKIGVRNTLRTHFGRLGRRTYVGADITVYYPGRKGFTPDVIAVADVDPTPTRDCWMVSKEGKGVDLALEVHYKGKWRKDFVDNVAKFAALGIREYFIHDLRREILKGYRLSPSTTKYELIPSQVGYLRSEVLDLDLRLEDGRIRFYEGSAVLVTDAELIGKLEQMVDAAAAQAKEQEARAEAALSQLSSALLTILTLRGLPVSAEARARVLDASELAVLERWLAQAATVASADELFVSD